MSDPKNEQEQPTDAFLVNGTWVDADGNPITNAQLQAIPDTNRRTIDGGRYIDERGHFVNANGEYIDADGNVVDAPVKAPKPDEPTLIRPMNVQPAGDPTVVQPNDSFVAAPRVARKSKTDR
jgi:hypothetical protein